MTKELEELIMSADPDSILGMLRTMKEKADEIDRTAKPSETAKRNKQP